MVYDIPFYSISTVLLRKCQEYSGLQLLLQQTMLRKYRNSLKQLLTPGIILETTIYAYFDVIFSKHLLIFQFVIFIEVAACEW